MPLMDIAIVLGIFGGFGYLILHRLEEKKPGMIKKLKGWFEEKKDKMMPGKEESNAPYVFEGDRGMM